MAEGPVVHYYAEQLGVALEGHPVRVQFGVSRLKPLEPLFDGVCVDRVEAHGKQFRIHFPDGNLLLVHLLMWGSWRIYRSGAEWDKPADLARVVLRTKDHEAVAFSAPIVQVMTEDELAENPRWSNLGPDPLREDFSADEFWRRLDARPGRRIGEAILDQSVLAGVGNILRNEILFRSHIRPAARVRELSNSQRADLLHWTLELCERWLNDIHHQRDWIRVYRRAGRPCPRCGTSIEFSRQGGRITYTCPKCQS